MNTTQIDIPTQLLDGAVMPVYAHDTDAGMDAYAYEDTQIAPGQTVAVRTGLKMAIPAGYEIQVRPRSGISAKTALRVANAPGTIDAGYRDEIKVLLENTAVPGTSNLSTLEAIDGDKAYFYQNGTFLIKKGDRIAQLVLKEIPKANLVQVEDVSKIGEDRGGGLGSTGVRGSAKSKSTGKTAEDPGV